jgi:hypothetical protein
VEAVFRGFDAHDRPALVREVEALVVVLKKAGLGAAIAPESFLGWTADALLRGDATGKGSKGKTFDYDGYRRLRAAEQRTSSAYTLAEIALVVAPSLVPATGNQAEVQAGIAALCARLPEETRARIVEGDLARIGRALDYLEAFWVELEGKGGGEEARLREIVTSRFFDLLWDDSALTRFALEARHVLEVFPGHGDVVLAVRRRIEELDARTRSAVTELFRRRSDEAWSRALGSTRK